MRRPYQSRLAQLAPLDAADLAMLAQHDRSGKRFARRTFVELYREQTTPVLVAEGWAARIEEADDRTRLLCLILPGDVLHPIDEQATRILALTDMILCPGPDLGASPALDGAYGASRRRDTAHLVAQIRRLAAMDATARVIDLFAELHARSALAGLTDGPSYAMPLTQQMVGDALGLTAVHVNRTVRALRAQGRLVWTDGRVTLPAAPDVEDDEA